MNIRDIAKISGVGVSTVSRVLNNHPDVKESTRERVLAVIRESNYVPNNSALIHFSLSLLMLLEAKLTKKIIQ